MNKIIQKRRKEKSYNKTHTLTKILINSSLKQKQNKQKQTKNQRKTNKTKKNTT
jgi:hypothetical protein